MAFLRVLLSANLLLAAIVGFAQPSGQRLRQLSPAWIDMGGTVGHANLADAAVMQIVQSEFSMVALENEFKPAAIHPSPNTYNWADADFIVNFAQANGQKVHAHVLLYPAFDEYHFFKDLSGSALVEAVNTHIDAVAGRYKGKIHVWDVVNEATSWNWSTLQAAVWKSGPFAKYYASSAFGPTFLAKVFNRAHAADPDAKLIYNDNVHDQFNSSGLETVYGLVKQIIADGGHIDGVGLQCHYAIDQQPGIARLEEYIEKFQALGLDVYFTEIDVDMKGSTDFAGQAAIYRTLLDLALRKGVKAFITWGVYDGYSWLNDTTWGSGPNSNPLLFDDNRAPKLAYYAVQERLAQEVPDPTVQPSSGSNRLSNLSARAVAGYEGDALFAGWVTRGGAAKRFLVRAWGPTLAAPPFNLNAPAKVKMSVYRSGQDLPIAVNTGWDESEGAEIAEATAKVGASPFASGSKDAAVLIMVEPDVGYTVKIEPNGGPAGVVVAEIWDAALDQPARLVNLSARAKVGASDADALFAGFVGVGDGHQRTLVRGMGPGLRQFGVGNALPDSMLEIFNMDAQSLGINDDWNRPDNGLQKKSLSDLNGAFAVPLDSRDACIIARRPLSGGLVGTSAIVRGKRGSTGVAIVEVYESP
ncbi:MAG: endo-1,4-beta-xylanase [Opitutaceae bacterium]|nr:endo-1,4-beta-xylanase [Opitutaceae bacterium]